MSEQKTVPCCYIGCDKPAEWEVWDAPGSGGDTLACSDHLGHLLADAPEHRVYPCRRAGEARPIPTPAPRHNGGTSCFRCGGHCCNLCGLYTLDGKYYCAACHDRDGRPMAQARGL